MYNLDAFILVSDSVRYPKGFRCDTNWPITEKKQATETNNYTIYFL